MEGLFVYCAACFPLWVRRKWWVVLPVIRRLEVALPLYANLCTPALSFRHVFTVLSITTGHSTKCLSKRVLIATWKAGERVIGVHYSAVGRTLCSSHPNKHPLDKISQCIKPTVPDDTDKKVSMSEDRLHSFKFSRSTRKTKTRNSSLRVNKISRLVMRHERLSRNQTCMEHRPAAKGGKMATEISTVRAPFRGYNGFLTMDAWRFCTSQPVTPNKAELHSSAFPTSVTLHWPTTRKWTVKLPTPFCVTVSSNFPHADLSGRQAGHISSDFSCSNTQ